MSYNELVNGTPGTTFSALLYFQLLWLNAPKLNLERMRMAHHFSKDARSAEQLLQAPSTNLIYRHSHISIKLSRIMIICIQN